MTSAALLDQDFGSESEDDNFNPAPADDSDNDAAGESDNEVTERPRTNGSEQTRRSTRDEGRNEDDQGDTSARPKEQHSNGRSGGIGGAAEDDDAVGEDDDDIKANGAGEDDEDDEEDEEDEDDEDEEVSVCLPRSTQS